MQPQELVLNLNGSYVVEAILNYVRMHLYFTQESQDKDKFCASKNVIYKSKKYDRNLSFNSITRRYNNYTFTS